MLKKFGKAPMVLLVLVLMLSALAACGGNNSTDTTNNSPVNENASNTTEEPVRSNLEGKVVFWSMWSNAEPQAKVIESAVADFKAANPNVEVDVKFVGRDIRNLIKPALDGGETVDIWEDDPNNAGGIPGMKEYVLKLDELLETPAADMEGSVKDTLIPSLMDWIKTLSTANGLEEGYYAIPQQPFASLFFYNKEVYEKAGVTKGPETWEEFMEINEKVKQTGVAPVTFDDAYRNIFIGSYLSSAMGHEWVAQLVTDKTGQMWNEPIISQFARDIAEMAEKGYFSDKIAGSKYPAAQQDLVLGDAAAYFNASWLPNEVISTSGPDFEWGAFQFPIISGGNGKGGHQELNFGSQGLFISKKSQNQEAAFELIKHLVSKKTQEAIAKEALAIPVTVGTEWPAQLADAEAAFKNASINIPWAAGLMTNKDFARGTIIPTFMELATGKLKAEEFGPAMSEAAKKFYAGQ